MLQAIVALVVLMASTAGLPTSGAAAAEPAASAGAAGTGAASAGEPAATAGEDIGFFDPTTGEWYLPGVSAFYFGNPGDNPLVGDWDCDGMVTPGLHRSSDGYVYLRNSNSQGIAELRYFFGNPGDVPLAGDWDGDGCDTVSLWRPSEQRMYIIDRLGSEDRGLGAADRDYPAGERGQVPFTFGTRGTDTVAFHDPTSGVVSIDGVSTHFGNPGDVVVSGTWESEPDLGAFRPSERLSFTNTSCLAGNPLWIPVVAGAPASSDGAVKVELDEVERRALGPGVAVYIEWPGGSTLLSDCAPRAFVDAPLGSAIAARYRDRRGRDAEVSWEQTVTGPDIAIGQPWRNEVTTPRSIVLAWQSTGDTPRYLDEIDRAPGLTVTSPIWWGLGADGSLTGNADAGFVAAAHDRSLEVWPAIASLDDDHIHAAMADPGQLAAVVSAAAQAVLADGVNIDLEGFRFEDADAVVEFATELTKLVHAWGGETSFDITPRSDFWDITSIDFDALFWSQAPPRRDLSEAVDLLILMAYDEHNAHRPAGPVASPHWVEDVTRYLLRYTDTKRLILGVPLYGRLWGPDLYDRPRAIDIGTLTASEANGVRSYDARYGLDRVDFANGTYLWSETPAALSHRRAFIDELGLAGVAAWRLGFDTAAVWTVIAPR